LGTCRVCGALIEARHFELRIVITKVGMEGEQDHASAPGGEVMCSSYCLLVRTSRLIDDANGAQTVVSLLATRPELVRRASRWGIPA
jgi:hypothetical protein